MFGGDADGSPPCIRGRGQHTWKRKRRSPVHPRAYGEEKPQGRWSHCMCGSPPCIRGRGLQKPTPTLYAAVHPRAYGEEGLCLGLCRCGSRFTPVHTGKSAISASISSMAAVHPRAYGEEVINTGSGPVRVRFTPVHTGKRLKYYGFECVFTSQMPSKSSNTTGALPHERISKPCSVFAGYKSTAQPPLMDSQVVAHKRERTRCESVPTYTPAFICSNHRVSLPRSAEGALETTRTINECPSMLGR